MSISDSEYYLRNASKSLKIYNTAINVLPRAKSESRNLTETWKWDGKRRLLVCAAWGLGRWWVECHTQDGVLRYATMRYRALSSIEVDVWMWNLVWDWLAVNMRQILLSQSETPQLLISTPASWIDVGSAKCNRQETSRDELQNISTCKMNRQRGDLDLHFCSSKRWTLNQIRVKSSNSPGEARRQWQLSPSKVMNPIIITIMSNALSNSNTDHNARQCT